MVDALSSVVVASSPISATWACMPDCCMLTPDHVAYLLQAD